jgi:hypothetical protein
LVFWSALVGPGRLWSALVGNSRLQVGGFPVPGSNIEKLRRGESQFEIFLQGFPWKNGFLGIFFLNF